MNVLILCAGYGTRLAPLTDVYPKPLVPLVDKPMLGHHLDSVDKLGAKKICINTHHLAKKLKAFAKTDKRIKKVFHEPDILGTGGPLHRMHAEGFTDDVLVVNADIYHTIDLQTFVTEARESGAPFVLMGIDLGLNGLV